MFGKFITCAVLLQLIFTTSTEAAWRAGAAKINITPSYPVRLSGYGGRTKLSDGVKVELWAKAIAISWDNGPVAILMTVDNCGVPASLRDEVLAMLAKDGIDSTRFALCSSHTHCAPAVRGALSNLFPEAMPPDHEATMNRYSDDLRDAMAKVSRQAIADMQPSKLQRGTGSVGFAMNRRHPAADGFKNQPYPEGPTDHDVPVLKITRLDGSVRAIFTSYACHCTTLGWNYLHPDWAGIAQLHMEMAYSHSGAIALTAIGCGADQNPYPRGNEDNARIHGYSLAREAVRTANTEPLRDILGPLTCKVKTLDLPFDQLPTKAELEKNQASSSGHQRRHAAHFLSLLEKRQPLPSSHPYITQAWAFGEDLAMVMLAGEVVVDYSLRLKREYDPARFWVNSYSNDLPCYIPSERVLKEGGYEGGGAMLYYQRPTKFAPGLEDKIINAIHEMLPSSFLKK